MPSPIYLDTCVMLSYLEGRNDRLPILDAIFDEAKAKSPTIELYTSVLSIAEVAYITENGAGGAITPDDLKKIEGFWSERLVKTIEVNERVARLGRQVLRDRRSTTLAAQELAIRGRSVDALHIGSALYLQCEEIWSYDPAMIRLSSLIEDCRICQPYTNKPRLL